MAGNTIVIPEKVQQLQRTLYRNAKKNPKWRAWSLYGDLFRMDLLEAALKQVIANGGGPGVDGVTIQELKAPDRKEEFLQQLVQDLKRKEYRAQPVKRVYISKANGKKRPLGIPCVKDRVLQTAVAMLLEPIFEADFHPNSYAYRPNKNAHGAIETIRKELLSGKVDVIDADLSGYFDTIPHAQLLSLVAKRVSNGSILALIKQWLKAPVQEEDEESRKKRIKPNKRGTPQGGVISPLLANIYLNDLDHAVNEKCGPELSMVRYADDFVICCKRGPNGESITDSILERLRKFLKRKGLQLNEEKTKVVNIRQEGLCFLGFQITWRKSRRGNRYYPHTEPAKKSQRTLREKVRKKLNHWTTGRPIADVTKEVNWIVRGWSNYYHFGNSTQVFQDVQRWTRNRYRRWLWRKHKCKKALWKHYTDEKLHSKEYGLYRMPLRAKY